MDFGPLAAWVRRRTILSPAPRPCRVGAAGAETPVNLACRISAPGGPLVDQPLVRLLIQDKLADGRLPRTPIPRVWGGPGRGETCDGCGGDRDHAQMVMENLDGREAGTSFTSAASTSGMSSARCTDTSAKRPPSGPLRVRDRRLPYGRRGRHPSRPPVRPTPRPHDARFGGFPAPMEGHLGTRGTSLERTTPLFTMPVTRFGHCRPRGGPWHYLGSRRGWRLRGGPARA